MLSPFEEQGLSEHEARMKQILADYQNGLRVIDAKYPFRSYVLVGLEGMAFGFIAGFLVGYFLMQNSL